MTVPKKLQEAEEKLYGPNGLAEIRLRSYVCMSDGVCPECAGEAIIRCSFFTYFFHDLNFVCKDCGYKI